MTESTKQKMPPWSRVINILLPILLLVFVLHADSKVWLLKQLMSVGLFSAEIKKEARTDSLSNSMASFSFQDAEGNVLSTNDLKGKVVFINFWATWCPPCRAEMPSLNNLYNQFKHDARFVFLFINEDDDPVRAKAYMQKNGWDMPLVFRTTPVPSTIFSGTLPTTVVLDAMGIIVMKHQGIAAYDTPAFIAQLKGLL